MSSFSMQWPRQRHPSNWTCLALDILCWTGSTEAAAYIGLQTGARLPASTPGVRCSFFSVSEGLTNSYLQLQAVPQPLRIAESSSSSNMHVLMWHFYLSWSTLT